MRIVLDSPATPTSPISMLLLPVVRLDPALKPNAMLNEPVVLFRAHENRGRVGAAGGVAKERRNADGGVVVASGVVNERIEDHRPCCSCRLCCFGAHKHRWPCCCCRLCCLRAHYTPLAVLLSALLL